MAVLIGGCMLGESVPADATPAPLGSPALYHWLTNTAARALQASDAEDDLSQGGLLAANSGATSGLDQLEALVPAWLANVDARFSVTADLDTRYGLSADRLIFHDERQDLQITAFGSVDVDQSGRRAGEAGISIETPLAGDPLEVDVAAGLQQEWLRERERYVSRIAVDWWQARFTGSMFNEQTMAEASGAVYEERLLDGYEVDLSTALPYATWIRIGGRHRFLAPMSQGADPQTYDGLSLRLTPIAGLGLEAGAEASTGSERRWFARLRYQLKLGGR